MPISTLATEDLYTRGKAYSKDDLRRADLQEVWVKKLPIFTYTPAVVTLTVDLAGASAGAESIPVTPDTSGTIYARDVLAFFTGSDFTAFAQVKTDTDLTATSSVNLPVLPLQTGLTDGDEAQTYLLKPVLSINSGGQPQTDATTFTSRNRHAGLYLVRGKGDVNQNMAISGEIIGSGRSTSKKGFIDPGLIELESVVETTEQVYFESRYALFDDAGTGYGEKAGRAIVNSFNPTSNDNNSFQTIDASLEISGQLSDYIPLGMTKAELDTFLGA